MTALERVGGFAEGLAARGITVEERDIVHTEFSRDGGYRAVEQLRDRLADLDVIAAMSDAMAVGVIARLRELGVPAPADIEVTGFDHVPMLGDVLPGFSTVEVPLEEFGGAALELASRSTTARTLRRRSRSARRPSSTALRSSLRERRPAVVAGRQGASSAQRKELLERVANVVHFEVLSPRRKVPARIKGDHMHDAMTRAGMRARMGRRSPWIAGAAGIAVAALALTGCSSPADDGDEGAARRPRRRTIRFLYATGDETWNSVVDSVVEAFNEQSDTTTVQLDPLPAGSDYATALKTMEPRATGPPSSTCATRSRT